MNTVNIGIIERVKDLFKPQQVEKSSLSPKLKQISQLYLLPPVAPIITNFILNANSNYNISGRIEGKSLFLKVRLPDKDEKSDIIKIIGIFEQQPVHLKIDPSKYRGQKKSKSNRPGRSI